MILFLYNLALLAILILGAPWWLWRLATTQKYREGLMQRLGRVPPHMLEDVRPLIWIHAVSVGEVLAVSRLVQELDVTLSGFRIAVSTTTRTGQSLAQQRFGSERVFYCPLDLPWAVRAYLNALRPRLLVLAETEFWPNLLSACFRRGIPVAVVNARVSDRSWPRYRRLHHLWRPFLEKLACVLAQSRIDQDRLIAIGCRADRVAVAGNLKFDVRTAESAPVTKILLEQASGSRFIVAGSTLDGEENALLAAWPEILESDSRLVLVLAPRHPERFAAVEALLRQPGLCWTRRSHWIDHPSSPIESGTIVLLDSIGELASVYSLASVALVGGSLIPAGGHNPLEPAQFAVPILMGPHYANFRSIVEDLRAQDALRIVTADDLATAVADLLRNPLQAEDMGQRARLVFEQQAGATQRCVQALRQLLANDSTPRLTR
jgi:3-deoxy-D-manno-octulosonic-acid transferase